jgi:hypothetical protein
MNLLAGSSETAAARESLRSSCDSQRVLKVGFLIVYFFTLSAHLAVSKRRGNLARKLPANCEALFRAGMIASSPGSSRVISDLCRKVVNNL